MENRNSFFSLVLKQDGTYLRLYPAIGTGKPVNYDEINNYLSDKKIYDYDIKVLGQAISVLNDQPLEVKITPVTILPENECVKITVSADRMYVTGRFYPPSTNGQSMTVNEVMNSLAQAGVKYGVIKSNIDSFLANRKYCEDIILARGTNPVEGKDAIITYNFNTDNTLKPKINEDGTVDFHQLDTISAINKGDILATLSPMLQGKAGMDVCGNVLTPKKVANKILKHGRDIHLSEDGLIMYSDVSGHAVLTDGKVFVSNTYEVLADVDASTGDIVYEGNVAVKGNVITGYSILAKGDIIVNGVVEGASLVAGGQIVLKRGMQGMSKGKMEAGSNIITKFIENAQVKAGGYITTEAILHSNVSAKGDITVGGKKGFITGGEIHSGTTITVKNAGSTMGTSTLLEVGIDPGIIEEFRGLEKSIMSMNSDMEKLLPIIEAYKKKLNSGEKLSQDKLDYIRIATENCITLRNKIKESGNRYDQLRVDMNNSEGGSIKVENIAYPGVKIVISNVNYYVRSDIHYSRFVRDRADIKVIGL
ncbi:MAG: FapA family protein [Anaerocolumna sp.]